MTSVSTHLIEQELASKRARLNDTIDRIQDKLTVSGIVDEVIGQAGVPRLASGHDYVLGLLRRNPLPVMIAAAGIGWYIYSRRRQSASPGPTPAPDVIDLAALNDGRARRYDPDLEARHPDSDATGLVGAGGASTRA